MSHKTDVQSLFSIIFSWAVSHNNQDLNRQSLQRLYASTRIFFLDVLYENKEECAPQPEQCEFCQVKRFMRLYFYMNVWNKSMHASIVVTTYSDWSHRGQSQLSLGKRQGTPKTGPKSVIYRDKQPVTVTPTSNLEPPIHLKSMFLVCGRRPEYPKRTAPVWNECWR